MQKDDLDRLVLLLNTLREERERNGGKFSADQDGRLKQTRELSESGGQFIHEKKNGGRIYWSYALGRRYESDEDYWAHQGAMQRGYDLEPSEVKMIVWALAASVDDEPSIGASRPSLPWEANAPSKNRRAALGYRDALERRLSAGLRDLLLAGRLRLNLRCPLSRDPDPVIETVAEPIDEYAAAAVLLHELAMQSHYLLRRCQGPEIGNKERTCGRFFITTRKEQRYCPGGKCGARQRTRTSRAKAAQTTTKDPEQDT